MSKPNRKATQKMISVFPAHLAMIERLILTKGIASTSEVFRQALSLFYDETFKVYSDNPKKQRFEEEKIQKIQEELVSDEDFALRVLKGKVVRDVNDNPFVLIYWFQSNVQNHFPLEGIKEWAAENKDAVDQHLVLTKEKNINDFVFSDNLKLTYKQQYGIILP